MRIPTLNRAYEHHLKELGALLPTEPTPKDVELVEEHIRNSELESVKALDHYLIGKFVMGFGPYLPYLESPDSEETIDTLETLAYYRLQYRLEEGRPDLNSAEYVNHAEGLATQECGPAIHGYFADLPNTDIFISNALRYLTYKKSLDDNGADNEGLRAVMDEIYARLESPAASREYVSVDRIQFDALFGGASWTLTSLLQSHGVARMAPKTRQTTPHLGIDLGKTMERLEPELRESLRHTLTRRTIAGVAKLSIAEAGQIAMTTGFFDTKNDLEPDPTKEAVGCPALVVPKLLQWSPHFLLSSYVATQRARQTLADERS